MTSSHVMISYHFYQFVTTRYIYHWLLYNKMYYRRNVMVVEKSGVFKFFPPVCRECPKTSREICKRRLFWEVGTEGNLTKRLHKLQ